MNPQQQANPIIKQEEGTNNNDVIDETNSYERQKARANTYYHMLSPMGFSLTSLGILLLY
jgi:hypothetical protein